MPEGTIICPLCSGSFELTTAMSVAIETKLRQQIEADAHRRKTELDAREKMLADQAAATQQAQAAIEQEVAAKLEERLKSERASIAAIEGKKAREAVADDIAKAQQDKTATELLLKERDAKLVGFQKKELDLLREKRELEDGRRELELSVERRLQEELTKLREDARKESDEQNRLKIAEREKTITDLQSKLQEALRKAEQGSQQLQGEVQELELEALLRGKFPLDSIEPVPKGEHGGDVLQRVVGPLAQVCGTILWESKRTKNWSDGWLPKLREDQRTAKAEVSVIVTQALPKGVESFDLIDLVWVAHPRAVIPVATVIRQLLVEVACARQSVDGKQTKMELVYQYLTGPRFRLRVQAVVDAFSSMQDDLNRERKWLTKQWEKRREELDHVMQATVGMHGDLEAIAGKRLPEIEGLDVAMLPVPAIEASEFSDPKQVQRSEASGRPQ